MRLCFRPHLPSRHITETFMWSWWFSRWAVCSELYQRITRGSSFIRRNDHPLQPFKRLSEPPPSENIMFH